MERGERYKQLINSGRWRRLRLAVLGARPYCEKCAAEGRTVPATEVHHITPVGSVAVGRVQDELCYDPRNLMSLCASCHRAEHLRMGKNGREERQRRCEAEAAALSERLWGKPAQGLAPGAELGKRDSRADEHFGLAAATTSALRPQQGGADFSEGRGSA